MGLPHTVLNVVIARRDVSQLSTVMRCSVFKMSCFGRPSMIPHTQTSPPAPVAQAPATDETRVVILAWLSARAARQVEAWPLVAVRRATRHSRRRRRQAPPSPMSYSTMTRRSLDGPHRRCSVSVADEHARRATRSRTGSATTRLPPPVEHEAVLDADDPQIAFSPGCQPLRSD